MHGSFYKPFQNTFSNTIAYILLIYFLLGIMQTGKMSAFVKGCTAAGDQFIKSTPMYGS